MTVTMEDVIAAFLESKNKIREYPNAEVPMVLSRRPWSKFARMLLRR